MKCSVTVLAMVVKSALLFGRPVVLSQAVVVDVAIVGVVFVEKCSYFR